MKKITKILIYVSIVIIYFLIIPEIILRVLTSEEIARVSDFTSFGGVINPLLSLLIFLGFFSVFLAIVTVSSISRFVLGGNK